MNNSLVECVLPKSCPYVPMCLILSFSLSGGPVLTPPFPQMQVQQLLQMKKQQQQAAAAQQKAGQPQQGQTTVQQKVATPHQRMLDDLNSHSVCAISPCPQQIQ